MRGTGELTLYLDFDGVLHHENCLWHPKIAAYLSAPERCVLFQHAELVEQSLAPYPQVRIVLLTTWGRRYGCSQAAKNLRPALRSHVIGATYHSNMRGHLSKSFRADYSSCDVPKRKPCDWVALDDVGEGWPEHARRHYVPTYKREGISDPQVLAELREKLERMCR